MIVTKRKVFFVLMICSVSFLHAQKSEFHIDQVSITRIKKHAQGIETSINRKKNLSRVALLAGSSYVLYSLTNWLRSNKNDNTVTLLDELNEDATNVEIKNRINELLRREQQRAQAQHNQEPQTGWKKGLSFVTGAMSNAFYWVGMPIILSAATSKVQKYLVSTQSIEEFDNHITKCSVALRLLVENIKEIAELISRSSQSMVIDKEDFAMICNRLIGRMEQMIGFIYAKSMHFNKKLKHEAHKLADQLISYTQDFSESINDILTEENTNYRNLAQSVAHFGQRYEKSKERFALMEQEA